MRKSIYLIFLISAFSLSTGSLYAVDLKDGFFDIQWKTNLSQLAGFKKVGENLNVSYYMNPKRVFTIDDIRIPDVVYGSHANQFFAVYVNIDNIEGTLRQFMRMICKLNILNQVWIGGYFQQSPTSSENPQSVTL